MPFSRLRGVSLYQRSLAPRGLHHQLAVTLRLTERNLTFVTLMRGLRDFTDRELAAVDRIRAPLSAALAYRAEVRAVQAARRLGITARTVRKHLAVVFAKAQVSSRTAAAAWWLRRVAR